MRKFIATIFASVFVLAIAAPAFADQAVVLRGTYSPADISDVAVPALPTSGEPGLLVTIQIDTNLGPVTQTVEIPFSTLVVHGNGGFRFQALGTVDFGNGNLLHTQVNGGFSFGSLITQVDEDVIGGEGIYAGATGSLHISGFELAASPSIGGFIAGVIL